MQPLPRALLPLALAAALLGASAYFAEAASAASGSAATQAQARKASPPRAGAKPLAPVAGEVIVRFKANAAMLKQHALAGNAKPETVATVLAKRASALGGRVGRTLEAGDAVGERMQVVRERGADAAELARRLAADPDVEFAEPNGRQRRLQTPLPPPLAVPPNDPLYAFANRQPTGPDAGQWYLRAPDTTFRSSINIEAAWARGFGSPGVVVAVLDTGVRFEHPDLGRVATGGRLLSGYDFVTDTTVANDGDARDADPSDPGDWVSTAEAGVGVFDDCTDSDSSWHGTATASLVGAAAQNATGMAGTAPGVRVLPVRVLGKCFGRDSDIQAAMRWAAGISVAGVPDNPTPAKVLNMSLGSSAACSAGYQAAVDEIVARGVVIVAAAGNSAGGPVGTPASCNGVVAVSALRHVGTKVGFSDLGPQITIAAPGGNCVNIGTNEPCLYPILAALNAGLTTPQGSIWSDSFDYTVGTSFASPLVAGVVALMFTQQPALTVAQIRSTLQSTARPFPATGGTAGTPLCSPPVAGGGQLECYCPNAGAASYPLCGAGMLDAGAALSAVAATYATIEATPFAPIVGSVITFDGSKSMAAPGRTIAGWAWTLVAGGAVATSFTGSTSGPIAALTANATGTVLVELRVIDNTGASGVTTFTVTVPAASTPEPPATPAPPANADSGGGALSWPWLLLLALAVGALARLRASQPRRS